MKAFFIFVHCSVIASATVLSLRAADSEAGPHPAANALTDSEKAAGWKLLFDGRSSSGWRSFKKDTFPNQGWIIEEGCLKRASNASGGDIITRDQFQDFDLQFEWKIGPRGNSGLKYFIIEDRAAAIGHEYQLVDNQANPDAKRGPKWQTASFYDVLPATNTTVRPLAEFNQSRIRVTGNQVEHWLNGIKVLEYKLESPELSEAIAQSKFRRVENFGKNIKGHILLQDHGDEISFRNIKIRELRPSPQ